MIESGECHTARINEMKDNALNGLEQLSIDGVSNCALSMQEILDEAQRRRAKHSVQYADYSLDTWTLGQLQVTY
jgi:hypothetical protein